MECNKCNENAELRCSRCKTKKYCSVECQKKDWKNHKPQCGKQLLIFLYKGDISKSENMQNVLGDLNNQIGYFDCTMYHSEKLKEANPQAKNCWEVIPSMTLPTPDKLPYTLLFTMNDQVHMMPIINYNNLGKDQNYALRIGNIRFGIYRSVNDVYSLMFVHFVEN